MSVESAVLAQVAGNPNDALVELALTLARKLDDDAGMATAAVARELRAILEDLATTRPVKELSIVDDLVAQRAARKAAAAGQ